MMKANSLPIPEYLFLSCCFTRLLVSGSCKKLSKYSLFYVYNFVNSVYATRTLMRNGEGLP